LQAVASSNSALIIAESTARTDADSAIASQITTLQSTVSNNTASIVSESTTRATADTALATDITNLESVVGANISAIQTEQTTRADADSALASDITILQTSVGNNASAISIEAIARADADEAISTTITTLTSNVSDNASAITAEATTRADADSALATTISTLQSTVEDNTSAIETEAITRADADTALATSITTLTSAVEDNASAISTEATTRATADTALATTITTLTSAVEDNTSAIVTEATTRATADTALATSISTLTSTVEDNSSAISTEATTRANADSALATDISTIQTTVGDNTTAIETTAESVDGIQGKYTVKIDNNGYVSGYGLISTANNDTPFSEFAIIADKFAIAPVATDPDLVDGSPFFVTTSTRVINGVSVPAGTYIKQANIYNASITTAKINDAAITNAKIANLAVDSAKIANATITSAQIANATITSAQIADATITNAQIANATIEGAKIASATITNANISTLDAGKVNTGTLSADRIASGSIVADKIDTRNLSIKDNAGNVVFSSAVPLSWNNSDIGLGVNILRNGGFEDGLAGWATGFYTTPTVPITGWNLSSDYNLKGTGIAFITVAGAVANTQVFDALNPDYIPVESSTRYEAQALVNTHRCRALVEIVWYDSALNYITENGGNDVEFASTVNVLSDLRQTSLFAISPSTAKFARVIIRGVVTTSTNDPFVFIKNVYFGQAGINQSTPSVWTAGRGINFINANNASTYIESASIGTAFIADAAITTAKIGDAQILTAKIGTAQIDTLRVAGNAITVQASVQRTGSGTSSFSIYSPTGGQILILAYFRGSDFDGRSLSVYVNGGLIGTVSGTREVSGFAGDELSYDTGQGSSMFLVSVGAGTTIISGTIGSGDYGFVLSGLLTMR